MVQGTIESEHWKCLNCDVVEEKDFEKVQHFHFCSTKKQQHHRCNRSVLSNNLRFIFKNRCQSLGIIEDSLTSLKTDEELSNVLHQQDFQKINDTRENAKARHSWHNKLRMKDVSLIILKKNDSFLVKHKQTSVIFVKTFNSFSLNLTNCTEMVIFGVNS